MLSLISTGKAQATIAKNTKVRRLQMDLTQEGLSLRSGVPLATLRKFEQKGDISLESFLKIQMALGGLEDIVKATELYIANISSIDEIISQNKSPPKKRGRRK